MTRGSWLLVMSDVLIGMEEEAEVDVEADLVDSIVMAAFIFSIFREGEFMVSRRCYLASLRCQTYEHQTIEPWLCVCE